MRRLLSLLLVVVAGLLPACNDVAFDIATVRYALASASTDYTAGAAARRSRGGACEFESQTDHYWDFEPDDADDDYLWIANIDALEASTYTLVAGVTYEANPVGAEYVGGMRTGGADESYLLRISGGPDLEGSTARNDCGTMETGVRADAGWGVDTYAVLAMTFAYSGNAGVGDSTKKLYVVRAGSTLVTTSVTAMGPINDCTGKVGVGGIPDLALNSWDGRIYWWAYYASELTQANLEDLFAGTLHPACDFTALFYWDGSKAVAVTYETEVGGYVLAVVGSPVQGP